MLQANQLFKSKGIKATAQRLIIYKVLENLRHATVDELIVNVKSTVPTISVATVYNILEAFTQAQIISKLYTDDNKLYYDISPSHHHHLYSDQLQMEISDYQDEELTQLIREHLAKKKIKNFVLEDIKLHLIGKFKK